MNELRIDLTGSANVFRDRFGGLDDAAWCEVLTRSLTEPVIDGLEFPGFPSAELQDRFHGHSGAIALDEAIAFYRFVKAATAATGGRFLDFGAGWGRISRAFMRDFDLARMWGFEPNLAICAVARALNPQMCFLNGGYLPDGTLPPAHFDLVVGWSVFSHLSPDCAAAWLGEFARVLRPGGHAVFTTWGERFLDRLIAERDAQAAGREIHWYSAACLAAAGDIAARRKAYRAGEFVWFTGHDSTLYGEAFVPPAALPSLLPSGLDLVAFDRTSLVQDAFVLRRTTEPA